MNCYDCAAHGHITAVAVCTDRGVAVCPEHAHLSPRWLTRTMPINRVVAVEPPARTIRCGVCQAARDAASPDADVQAAAQDSGAGAGGQGDVNRRPARGIRHVRRSSY